MKTKALLIILAYLISHELCATEQTTTRHVYDRALTEQLENLLTKDYHQNRSKILNLITEGADPNAQQPDELSKKRSYLLHRACDANDLEVVRSALERGANANSTFTHHEHTPLMWAKSKAVVQCLLDHKANVDQLSTHYENPLHLAISESVDTIQALCNSGAKPNQKTRCSGNSPLHEMFFWSVYISDIVPKTAVLLGAGCNPRSRNAYGETCLDILQKMNPALVPAVKALIE